MTSAETSGWSPRATSSGPGVVEPRRQPIRSELDSPRSGSGFTTRCSSRQSIAASTRRRRAEHDDDVASPASRERVEDVLEDRPAAERARACGHRTATRAGREHDAV